MWRLCKRPLELLITVLALILLMPLLILLAILVRLKLGSPILFCQQRPGLHGRIFTLLKFRTMTDARDNSGNLLSDEKRLTRFGKFLRNSSLDELPELLNVVKGEMSIIGPRPLLIQYIDRYTPEQMRRHEVRPGITGWAQVNGRNLVDWQERFKMDVWYVDNMSFFLDLKILWMTARKVLIREGVSAEGHATMPPFMGNPNDSA